MKDFRAKWPKALRGIVKQSEIRLQHSFGRKFQKKSFRPDQYGIVIYVHDES